MSIDSNRFLEEEPTNYVDLPAERATARSWVNFFWAGVIAAIALFTLFSALQAASPSQNTATCTVQANRLNLRAGPGTNYRSDGLLNRGTTLRATGRNSASTWIKVTVTSTSRQGWVAYGSQLATCTSALSRLPVATAPPATGSNAATTNPNPSPQPLPEPIALAPLPTGGGGDTDLLGTLVTEEDDFDLKPNPDAEEPNDTNNPDYIVFSDRLNLALDLTRRPSSGPVAHFGVSLTSKDTFETVWAYDLNDVDALANDPICFFGGETDDCVEIDLRAGATWPQSTIPVTNGLYDLNIDVENLPASEDDSISSRTWFGIIEIDSPNLAAAPTEPDNGGGTEPTVPEESPTPTLVPPVADQDPVIEFIETAPGTNDSNIFESLTFQVAAWDPDAGTDNGDGIEYLYMDLNDPEGNVVAYAEYNSPAFCGFGQDGDGCYTWWFADNNYAWPSGALIEYGNYTLYVNAVGSDGSESEATLDVILQ